MLHINKWKDKLHRMLGDISPDFTIPPAPEERAGVDDNQDFGQTVPSKGRPVSQQLKDNLDYVQQQFCVPANKDLVVRQFRRGEFDMVVLYLDGMSSRKDVSDFILRPLMGEDFSSVHSALHMETEIFNVLEVSNAQKQEDLDEGIRGILMGDSLLLVDGLSFVIVCETKGYDRRSVSTPQTEGTIRGPQEAFTENLKTNTTLIRRIIKNPRLVTEYTSIGDLNRSPCAILYIDGLCNPAIVEEVRRRINSLKGDYIFGSGMLEQFIEDSPYSIFPTILSTERPDRTASNLNEGRVAVIADGTPFAIIMPITFLSMLTTTEDTALRWQYGTLMRFVRVLALMVTIFLPALYIGLTNFHKEMIPTDLLIAIAQSRENVPFPSAVEVVLMILSFELIREAGTRVPGLIGNTIGIVGALILGQASVEASLVSPVLIIIIAFTGIGSFALPDFALSFGVRIVRMGLLLCGAVAGFVGIALGTVVVLSLMVRQQSFGIPVMASFDAPRTGDNHDLIFRKPVWRQELRDRELHPLHRRNQPRISRRWTCEKPAQSKQQEGK